MQRTQRRLAWPLMALWLLLSNAALCLVMPAAPAAGEARQTDHGDPQAAAASAHMSHPGPAAAPAGSGTAAPGSAGHDCCAGAGEYPCCDDAVYAPAFDGPVLAKLLAAVPAAVPVAPLSTRAYRPVFANAVARPPAQAGPPVYLRCCSFLI